MEKLTRIANKCGTDKGTEHFEKHGYTEVYGKYIPETGDYALLEIGVYHCESMRMWQEYAPDMRIIGVDISLDTPKYMKKDDDYALFIGDATNPEFIEKIMSFVEDELDFIIDDGSHKYEDILASFKLLYPKLKSGGYYFIEDLHAGQARKHDLIAEITSNYDFKNFGFRCDGKLWIIEKP